MGLMSFVKSVGNKIFAKPEEASVKISSHIEEDNPGIKTLRSILMTV
jgi:hypothetical protein